uniref:Uncharacterized protein n=1 Tax=Magallana gigas TaxID=29159 RepID=A0A8W8MAC2_MAGGI
MQRHRICMMLRSKRKSKSPYARPTRAPAAARKAVSVSNSNRQTPDDADPQAVAKATESLNLDTHSDGSGPALHQPLILGPSSSMAAHSSGLTTTNPFAKREGNPPHSTICDNSLIEVKAVGSQQATQDLWDMTPTPVYDIPMSRIEAMERLTTKFLRRWLSIPHCFSSVGLYSAKTIFQLPPSSLIEEYKVTKVRQHLTLTDRKDEKVRGARVNLEAGRKWSVQETVLEAELHLKQAADIVENVQIYMCSSLETRPGNSNIIRWGTADKRVQRKLVQKEVQVMEGDSRIVKAVGMKKQGSWVNWEAARQRKVTWSDIWSMEPNRLQFLLRSVYDVLPSPTNMAVWGLSDDPNCKLCGKPALEQKLSSCSVALSEGRYTWQHGQILLELADSLSRARKRPPSKDRRLEFINFV